MPKADDQTADYVRFVTFVKVFDSNIEKWKNYLGDLLYNGDDEEIELHDFTPPM